MKKLVSLLVLFCVVLAQSQVLIVVNKDLFPFIEQELVTFARDIEATEKQNVWMSYTKYDATSSATELRAELASIHNGAGLKGAIFVGDLPIAMYEVENDFPTYRVGSGYGYGYKNFPVDLFYMDLDGKWLDNATTGQWGGRAKTGYFDGHEGNREAEIWVSRITSTVLGKLGEEVDVVKSYLNRVHTRMAGLDNMPRNYLIFGNNGDWSSMERENIGDLDYAPEAITTYKRPNDTRGNWMAELNKGHEYALLYEHSSPAYTSLIDGFNITHYMQTNSNVRFFNLFACSNARYTVANLGGYYALGKGGLVSLGSTKTGSMLGFRSYNMDLGKGVSFGESFRLWMNKKGITNLYWHYGMTLQGAGTLKLQPYGDANAFTITSSVIADTVTNEARAWVDGQVYTGGSTVSYNNHNYKAKWWTSSDVPGAASWVAWEDLGVVQKTITTGGTISPAGTVAVEAGTDQAFSFTAKSGYVADYFVVDGVVVSVGNPEYLFQTVDGAHDIKVHFKKQ